MDLITPILTYLELDTLALIGIGAGALGGCVKGMYSAFIDCSEMREVKILKFSLNLIVSIILGGVIGYLFNFDYRVSGLAGFAGMDILTNIGKASISSTKFVMNKK